MRTWRPSLTAWFISALLAGCGGGDSAPTSTATSAPPTTPVDPGAPTLTGNTATDGFNWFNYRRAQLGLSTLTRNSLIDAAAQGHSDYQRLNNVITHVQTVGNPGFTGAELLDRLRAAGYALTGSYAAGEVISATSHGSGADQAEALITAIYHRFVVFEPLFREIGTGAASVSGGYTFFTADLAVVNGYSGLGKGKFVSYPFNNQSNVPVNFFSDQESPDPVPDQNEVGYPISVHADAYGSSASVVVVQSFSVAPRGGAALATRLLSYASGNTDSLPSVAAIIPLAPLQRATVYDVSFSGQVGGVAVNRSWSFTTQ